MTDSELKDLYEFILGVKLLPHQLQTLKQLRRDEAKNKMDEINAHESDLAETEKRSKSIKHG